RDASRVGGRGFPPKAATVDICLTPCEIIPDKDCEWFPALIDTGCSHNLSIGQGQLKDLAGREITEFERYSIDAPTFDASGGTTRVPVYMADLWIRSTINPRRAIKVEMSPGFSFYGENAESPGPPYPLLGTRALGL